MSQFQKFLSTTVKSVTEEKILGIVIDNKVSFKLCLKNICKKTDEKLSALLKILELTTFNSTYPSFF